MNEPSEDPAERARKYILNMEKSIQELTHVNSDRLVKAADINRVSDTTHRYLQDANYYLEHDKPTTALASIAYAEGLLDSLTFLGLTEAAKKPI
jgi:FAD synthetase